MLDGGRGIIYCSERSWLDEAHIGGGGGGSDHETRKIKWANDESQQLSISNHESRTITRKLPSNIIVYDT